jgi:hypothetical protein
VRVYQIDYFGSDQRLEFGPETEAATVPHTRAAAAWR